MKAETKFMIYISLFNSLVIAVVLVITGGLIQGGAINWAIFLPQVAVGFIVGFFVSMVIPVGKIGGAAAAKFAKPGTFLFKLIMYIVLLAIMLVFLLPIMTLFTACVLMGAPVGVMLSFPILYGLFPWFEVVGVVFLLIFDIPLGKLAMKCAGMQPMPAGAAPGK